MREPLLSIVTITYNDAEGLGRTVRSLRALHATAGAPLWEHVIVDSSPAANAAAIGALRAEDWPLAHLTAPPEGIYPALNRGVEEARGRFVWLLNGGDELKSPAALERALAELSGDDGLELVCSAAELRRKQRFLYLHVPRASLARDLVGMNRVCQQAVLYRKTVFEKLGLFSTELKLAADYEHHLRALAAGVRAKALPGNVLAVFDMDGSSAEFRRVFAEFKQAQRGQRGALPLAFTVANELVRPLEYARVSALKALGQSPLGGALRPLWLALKRRRQ